MIGPIKPILDTPGFEDLSKITSAPDLSGDWIIYDAAQVITTGFAKYGYYSMGLPSLYTKILGTPFFYSSEARTKDYAWKGGVTYRINLWGAKGAANNMEFAQLAVRYPPNYQRRTVFNDDDFDDPLTWQYFKLPDFTPTDDTVGNIQFENNYVQPFPYAGTVSAEYFIDEVIVIADGIPVQVPDSGQEKAPLWERWELDQRAGVLFPYTDGAITRMGDNLIELKDLADDSDRDELMEYWQPRVEKYWRRL